MKFKKGARLFIFVAYKKTFAAVKLSQVEKIASHLSEKLKMIDEVIKHAK